MGLLPRIPGKSTQIHFFGAQPGKKLATPLKNSIVETPEASAREALRQNCLVVILWEYFDISGKVENG